MVCVALQSYTSSLHFECSLYMCVADIVAVECFLNLNSSRRFDKSFV